MSQSKPFCTCESVWLSRAPSGYTRPDSGISHTNSGAHILAANVSAGEPSCVVLVSIFACEIGIRYQR